jgi:hypothetical protein
VPLRPIVRFGFEAFDVMESVPPTLPDAAGLKLALKVKLCPVLSVTGGLIPLNEKPAPDAETCERVTADPPVLVTVWERVLLLPMVTLPKF